MEVKMTKSTKNTRNKIILPEKQSTLVKLSCELTKLLRILSKNTLDPSLYRPKTWKKWLRKYYRDQKAAKMYPTDTTYGKRGYKIVTTTDFSNNFSAKELKKFNQALNSYKKSKKRCT